jgi:hypothetical protein
MNIWMVVMMIRIVVVVRVIVVIPTIVMIVMSIETSGHGHQSGRRN